MPDQTGIPIIATSFSSSQISTNKNSPLYQSSSQIGMEQNGVSEIGIAQISTSQIGTSQNTAMQVGSSQIGISQIRESQSAHHQASAKKVSPRQITSTQFNSEQVSSTQIDSTQVQNLLVNPIPLAQFDPIPTATWVQIDSSKVTLPSSISIPQFINSDLPSHNSAPKITNRLNNNATNIWSNLLQAEIQLDIDFQITDLPTGQLAEATITGFDDSGVPNAGTIQIDHDANGVGWFIDRTPFDNSEFTAQNTDSCLFAAAESEADGKYDLLTTVLHELAHLYGFIDGYEGFDANIETENGTTKFIGDDFEAVLDGEHLDKFAHPNDLMNTHLAPGVRKLPSELDVQILQALVAT